MSTPDSPVAQTNRYATLDVLRGFAVMAIFIVNIKAMVQPFPFYMNATLWPGEYDKAIAGVLAFVIDDKWRTIFTALFGAGIVLIAEKTLASGGDPKQRLRRRLAWLLVFGLIHLIGMWMGDILTLYALAGFVAMLFWRKPARSLWVWAFWVGIIATIWMSLLMYGLTFAPPEDSADMRAQMWGEDPEYIAEQLALYGGPFWGHVLERAKEAPLFIGFYVVFGGFGALTVAIMLAGMALWKTGYLRAEWTASSYTIIAIVGLAIAYGLDAVRWLSLERSDWAFEIFLYFTGPNVLNGLAGAMGYSALILLLCKVGLRFSPVAAVGRMAFSNYIACTLIGTTLAASHGFGRFGELSLQQLMYVVLATWAAMLIWSPLWLARFRFGPLEWLWRSLSYGRAQPFVR